MRHFILHQVFTVLVTLYILCKGNAAKHLHLLIHWFSGSQQENLVLFELFSLSSQVCPQLLGELIQGLVIMMGGVYKGARCPTYTGKGCNYSPWWRISSRWFGMLETAYNLIWVLNSRSISTSRGRRWKKRGRSSFSQTSQISPGFRVWVHFPH